MVGSNIIIQGQHQAKLTLMASRQPLAADPHLGLEEEDAVSGTGEGDEIMEEAEEQEDGYSAYLI